MVLKPTRLRSCRTFIILFQHKKLSLDLYEEHTHYYVFIKNKLDFKYVIYYNTFFYFFREKYLNLFLYVRLLFLILINEELYLIL